MPLIEIHSLPGPEIDRPAISRSLNAAVAEALGCRSDAVWTTWRTIDVFARGDDARIDRATGAFGPIVHVYHHRTPEEVELIVEAIETVLARELSAEPSDVFITLQPVAIEVPGL